MDDRFRRGAGEKILIEGSGVRLLPTASLGEKLLGANVDHCKFYLTVDRVVCAEARKWAQTRSALVALFIPFFWLATVMTPRPLLFEIAVEDLVSCTYVKRKGRFVFADRQGRGHTFVSHAFNRSGQARRLFAKLAEVAPNARCAVFTGKGDLTPEAVAALYE